MVNQEYYNLGTAPSIIRQLFAYGLEQAKIVGPRMCSIIRWAIPVFQHRRK